MIILNHISPLLEEELVRLGIGHVGIKSPYEKVEDWDDVLRVDGLDGPLLLAPLQAEDLIGEAENDLQLVALALFGLGHLRDLELLSG